MDCRMHHRAAAAMRDFSINALLYDPLEGQVLDFVGGLDDLRSKVRWPHASII